MGRGDGATRRPAPLLTIGAGNPKTAKGEGRGYLTAVLHLAPSKLSGYNVCPMATPGCIASCLNSAGRGGMYAKGLHVFELGNVNEVQRARVRRTLEFHEDRARFMLRLREEIGRFVWKCRRVGLLPAVRLNGTSDIRFERIAAGEDPSLMLAFPGVQFYDYTKLPNRRDLPDNYHLTYSLAEGARAWRGHLAALDNGLSVAVVLRGCGGSGRGRGGPPLPFPKTWNGRPLVDGDAHDLRFGDAAGVYVGLRAKGRALRDTSGFVFDAVSPTLPTP